MKRFKFDNEYDETMFIAFGAGVSFLRYYLAFNIVFGRRRITLYIRRSKRHIKKMHADITAIRAILDADGEVRYP